MKKITAFLFLILGLRTILSAQIPAGYYTNADGKTGAQLKTALYDIIKNPSVTSYGGLYASFQTTDIKPNGKVWDMYSDIPGGTPPYQYSYGSGTCGNYSKEGDCYNREHSFPQSWFNSSSPMVSDLFHLYPTDGKVNGIRNNFPYGEVGAVSITTQNGSKLGTSKSPGYSGTVFEPIDEYKGDLARGVLYMVTCYENQISAWQGNGNADNILSGNTFPSLDQWHINLLAKWHQQDPVSTKEINRNNAAYVVQHNRNPFIDHPEYAGLIWGFSTVSGTNTCTGIAPSLQVSNIAFTNVSNNSANVTWTNGNGKGRIVKINSSNTFNNPIDGNTYTGDASFNNAGEQVAYSGTSNSVLITGLNTLTTYYIRGYEYGCSTTTGFLYATTATGNNPASFTTLTVPSNPSGGNNAISIINQNFTPCPATGWQTIQVSGNKNWFCNAGGFMEANGFISSSSTAPGSEAWLISPSLDTRSFTGITLSFKSATRYTDNGLSNPQMTVYYSTNYTGTGSPTTATWSSVNGLSFPSSNTDTDNSNIAWTNSGVVTINGLNALSTFFAVKYKSSGSANTSSTRWRIDDFMVSGFTTITGVVTIPGANHAPVAEDVTISGFNSDTLKGNLSGKFSDPDNDALNLIVQNDEPTAFFGTVSIFDDGSFLYKSPSTFTGIDSFIYSVCDQTECGYGKLIFKVTQPPSPNLPPVAENITFTGAKARALSGNINAFYSDPENDPLTLTPYSGPLPHGGSLALNANGSFSYIPLPSFTGNEMYNYTVCSATTCTSAIITFNITTTGAVSAVSSAELAAIVLYPNPATEEIHLKTNLENGQKVLIEISDLPGVVLLRNELVTANENIISINGFPSGIYVLKATFAGGHIVLKLKVIR